MLELFKRNEVDMKKVIVEVGSTNTKIDECNGKNAKRLDELTIRFKGHYKELGHIDQKDIETLLSKVLELKKKYEDIFVCGTSIFRDLAKKEQSQFLKDFSSKTGLEFNIISQEQENELTVLGATRSVNSPACVLVGGGGSTEISIVNKGITEFKKTSFGVMDVMEAFSDLADDVASTPLETVMAFIEKRLNVPETKVDILILAGGGHEVFARGSGIKYWDNTLYNDTAAPIMMDIETRKQDTKEFFEKTSLETIKKKASNPDWWFATRAMCAFVLVVAEKIGAKYIVPTNMSMVYGLL